MNGWVVLIVTIALIAASGFFVVIEFALLGARRYRLEEDAPASASARAALRGVNELTVMLAGAQLGITACTFALGAVTKPAVDYWLGPVLASWGLPEWLAGGTSFALSLLLVTFLHLVVGEMAPKSWAIAHPERAAKLIGIPSRVFVWPFRPLLLWVNHIANALVARTGVEPVARAAAGGHDADTLRQLIEHSTQVGALEPSLNTHISGALELQTLTAAEITVPNDSPTSVAPTATLADVRAAASASGHLRILVLGDDPREAGVVHVRDTLLEDDGEPVSAHRRDAYVIDGDKLVHEVLREMQEYGVQLAVVVQQGQLLGLVTMADIIARVLPQSRDPEHAA